MKFVFFLCSCMLLSSGTLAREAAVAMPNRHSAEVAIEVMQAGGNAVDASIAAAFVLAVTLPEAGNIGGGGFMTSVVDGVPAFLDFRERAPGLASRDMYQDEHGEVDTDLSYTGALSIGVPGTVKGMQEAHARYGTRSWTSLLQPAIRLARDGFVVHPELASYVRDEMVRLEEGTNFEDYYAGATMGGEVFRQPELAQTLETLASNPDAFYKGEIADLLVQQMVRSGGLISHQDLLDYTAVWREPLQFQWRDYQVIAAPPPSSGGVALAQLLGIHEFAATLFEGVTHNSAQYLHLLAEIEKRVFADRGKFLGDPDFHDNPVQELMDPEYLKRRATEINPIRMSAPETVEPGLESPETTHFSIVDGDGNAVSITYTLNWDFGSGVVVEGAGFLLNDEMDDFSAKPGVANKFGVIGDKMNAIAPGKRMLSSMTPTVLLRDGEVAMVIGTQGGSTIFTSVFQALLNVVEFNMSAEEAVNADRFHHQLPQHDLIRYDRSRSIPDSFVRHMAEYGYRIEPNSWGDLGKVRLVVRTSTSWDAAADSRSRRSTSIVEQLPVVQPSP
jgi:gamma-glutamyltranspeptidase / glutathione hydrolase